MTPRSSTMTSRSSTMTSRSSTMTPTRKQWGQLVLVAMLAWLLIFLALLYNFVDLRAMEPRSRPSLAHTETRRLASIQGSQRGIRASNPDVTSSSLLANQDPGPVRERIREEARGAEQDPQRKAASLASGGTTRNTVNGQKEGADQERAEERKKRERQRMRGSLLRAYQRGLGVGHRRDNSYLSQSKTVVQRLWHGDASVAMLIPRLQKSMRNWVSLNKHHVAYRGRRGQAQDARGVLCELKERARLKTLDGTEQPFSGLGWDKLVPVLTLEHLSGQGSKFKSCAVVASAGAMLHSSLGNEIDSHEAVLRFNSAPTEGYENDVGNKTTIRIINSQIPALPRYHFNTSSLYQGISLVAWDPAPYSVDLPRWYRNPDYDLFTPYKERRRLHPNQPFYILHPKFIWQLWDVIQGNFLESIQPNPPSSGFIGILLMMSLCEEVHVYEYIPSLRQTDLCHYHERYYDAACTLGAYHPLLYEKLLVQKMNTGSLNDLKTKGKITLPGFSSFDCGP
ncbi:beta-galactoside alpha-2,6-sialyltransferase 2 [Esox lucius]|uniref:beta-galactoside alpha-2,6-sialyltransferase 2 n=1 Tax=Esox lucius TaxID=8010 RepID=UPI001476EF84|nr:beta-galactoside alpha-2,6-sialyltransferase 2 [Esox lucius]